MPPVQKNFTRVGVLLALFLCALDRYTWLATAYLLATTIMAPIYGKLPDTLNRKSVELAAAALFLAGSFLCGLGLGPTFPLYTLAVQNAVEPRYLGQATGTSIFFRQIGGTVGVAVMGTVLAGVLAALAITLFIPEIPLRRTQGPPAAAV